MPHLDPLLSFPIPIAADASASPSRTPIPPSSSHILVTDTLDSPASFVLVHFLRAALSRRPYLQQSGPSHSDLARAKPSAGSEKRVVWIGCDANGLGHWKNVARKSGVQLDTQIARESFHYIDATTLLFQRDPGEHESRLSAAAASSPPRLLKRLYDSIAELLQRSQQQAQQAQEGETSTRPTWEAETLVIVDDLSALAWSLDAVDDLGRPVDIGVQVSRWMRAMRTLAAKHRACLVTLQHADATSVGPSSASDAVDETLFRSLCTTADVWIEVKALLSGRARDCDGELTVHPLVRPSLAASSLLPSQGAQDAERYPDVLLSPPLEAFAIETPCPSRGKAMLYRIAPDGQSATSGGGAGIGTSTGRVQVWARGTGRGFL